MFSMGREDISEQRPGDQDCAHLLRLVPLLGLGRQILRLRLLAVVRLLALLAVTAHTWLAILRRHLSRSQAGQVRKSRRAIQRNQIWFQFSNRKWVLC